jgi:hypothetical protein
LLAACPLLWHVEKRLSMWSFGAIHALCYFALGTLSATAVIEASSLVSSGAVWMPFEPDAEVMSRAQLLPALVFAGLSSALAWLTVRQRVRRHSSNSVASNLGIESLGLE